MAEHVQTPESREQDDSQGVSPGANSDSTSNNAPKASAVKDRACPFCRQAFTSSSLGRHLDTYIRAKNPKPPDGVHDVAEIRKIRGNITRRHARNSSAAAEQSSKRSSAETQQRPLPNGTAPLQPVQPTVQPQPPMHHAYMTDNSHSVFRTKADWTATGVINNLPPRSSATPNSRDLPYPRPDFQSDRHVLEDSEERENARATELALKEVLDSVQDAVSRAQKPPIFNFDLLTLNFPALCLRVLNAPSTLFSATPTSAEDSWPLDLPSRASYERLRALVAERMTQAQQASWGSPVANSGGRAEQGLQTGGQDLSRNAQSYSEHIDNTYSHWSQLSDTRKQEVWDLELMRAYADELKQNKVLDQQLDDAYREIRHLRAQIDGINRQQPWQRSRSPHASQPNLSPALLPRNVAQQMVDANVDLREWDFDRLVTKWKHTIRPRRNWAWTNAPPPPSGVSAVQDTRPSSNSGAYTRSFTATTDSAKASAHGNILTAPFSTHSPADPLPSTISATGSPAATGAEQRDRTPGSDVEMKDQEPAQARRSRRMFAKEGAG